MRDFYGTGRGSKLVYSRIFLFVCLYSFFQIIFANQCTSVSYQVNAPLNKTFTSLSSACSAVHAYYMNLEPKTWVSSIIQGSAGVHYCRERVPSGQFDDRVSVYEIQESTQCECQPKDTNMGSAFLRRNGELFTPPAQICRSKCLYDFSNAAASQEVRSDGSITTVFVGDAISLQAQCPQDTDDDTPPPLNPCRTRNAQGQFVDKDYCDAPPTGCPSGYVPAMFNGKKICVKQETNDRDNCRPTVAEPYKCLPNQPDAPEGPNDDGNCTPPKIRAIIGTTVSCLTPETPPNPDGSCPKNYVKQTYDGISTCVPDNQRPDADNNCPLNTALTTLPDGSKVCRSGNGNGDGNGGASEPVGTEGGSGDCDPKKDFLCLEADMPNSDSEKLTVNELQLPDLDENKLSWSKSCPAPQVLDLSFKTYRFEYSRLCSFLTDYVNPIMIALGYLSGAFIIIGAVRK